MTLDVYAQLQQRVRARARAGVRPASTTRAAVLRHRAAGATGRRAEGLGHEPLERANYDLPRSGPTKPAICRKTPGWETRTRTGGHHDFQMRRRRGPEGGLSLQIRMFVLAAALAGNIAICGCL